MKCENCPSETDSLSTRQRIKKFHRKSTSKSPRSRSNHSESQSVSKFFVLNLQVDSKPDKIDEILNKKIKVSNDWSPPARQPTPAKGSQKKNQYNEKELTEIQKRQIQNLKLEVQKYKKYSQKQSQKFKKLLLQNKAITEQVQNLKCHLIKEKENNKVLQQKINQFMVDQNQTQASQLNLKQQPSLRKMKGMIFQSRIIEFQKERDSLNKRIKQLEEIVGQNSASCKSDTQNKTLETKQSLMSQKSTIDEQDHLYKLQSQLYDAKQCIKRLQISETCSKRKYNTELQTYSKKRDKEYHELRNKFNQFLNKYKSTMKQMASFKVQNALGGKVQRSNSIESSASFTLSEGD